MRADPIAQLPFSSRLMHARAPTTAAATATAPAVTPMTRAVEPRPPARSATRIVMPVATEQATRGCQQGRRKGRMGTCSSCEGGCAPPRRARSYPPSPPGGRRRGAAPPTQTQATGGSHSMGTAGSRSHAASALTQACPLPVEEVCRAAGAGAHLHGFIERVESMLSTCSDAPPSTYLQHRSSLHGAVKRAKLRDPQLEGTRMPRQIDTCIEHGDEGSGSWSSRGVAGSLFPGAGGGRSCCLLRLRKQLPAQALWVAACRVKR